MHSMVPSSLLICLLTSLTVTSALPSPANGIEERAAAATPSAAPAYNLTQLTCTPPESDGTQQEYPDLTASACQSSYQNFTATHSAPQSSASASKAVLTFTSNVTLAKEQPQEYVASPIEIAADQAPISDNAVCGLSYAIYYGASSARPNVPVTFPALANATNTLINHCTGKAGNGNGGGVVLTLSTGSKIDISIYRPV